MAQAVGALRVEMEAGEARIKSDFGKARKHAKKFNDGASKGFRKTNRAAADMTRMIKRSAAAILFIAGPAVIGAFVKASITAAGDAAEAWSKFDAVFKDQAEATRSWALEFADNVGRSRSEVAAWLATLQDTFVPMGIARDKAADLSKELVSLAVDLGSFNNIADQEVIEALQSALVGNTETMRKFGIVINETNTKQEAWSAGITENGAKLTEQDKILARLNLIMAGTKDAQGDVERTADSLNNMTKTLNSTYKNFTEELGNKFVPAATEATGALTSMLEGATDTVTGMSAAQRRFRAASDEVDRLSERLPNITNAFVKADLQGRLDKASDAMVRASEEIAVLRGEVVLTGGEVDGAAGSVDNMSVAINDMDEPVENLAVDWSEMNKEIDKTDEMMQSVSIESNIMLRNLDRLNSQVESNIVTMDLGVTQGEAMAEIFSAMFAVSANQGDAFKSFVLKLLNLIEATIVAAGALSKTLTVAFTPFGIAASITALGVLEAAKAAVRSAKFATGGQFIVGGSGGTDTTPVSFLATRGEEVTVRTPAQVAAGAMLGGGGGGFQQNLKVVFEGITPEEDLQRRIIPGIQEAARAGATDILSRKNFIDGTDLGGEMTVQGKG